MLNIKYREEKKCEERRSIIKMTNVLRERSVAIATVSTEFVIISLTFSFCLAGIYLCLFM